MKKISLTSIGFALSVLLIGCADNSFEELPQDDNYPFRLVLDTNEGGDLADAEDYGITIKFADYLPDLNLPNEEIIITYQIKDLEDDMVGSVRIDKVIYEVEIDDCIYERELDFSASADGLTGSIVLASDEDLGSVPEEFEVVVTLPGGESSGSFIFEITAIETTQPVLLGSPREFEYAVLDNEVAGGWEFEITSDEEFESFKEIFGQLNADIEALSFSEITGTVKAEFEFGEMKFEIELIETEEITSCENGESETETVNKVIEFEAEYEVEDGEFVFEGSREIINDNGLVEDELDFMLEGTYEVDEESGAIRFTFLILIDEDNYEAGEELYASEIGVSFTFNKD
ncbi:MAG: hypothetical protein KF763_15505 [Cyclobacteriaceae bacterium]|nr:hypothetical protein [Cyclobacteriaceae bacterium]